MTDKFTARTRVRGEIDYHYASWDKSKSGSYVVEFLSGPHKGEKYTAVDVAIAKKEWR